MPFRETNPIIENVYEVLIELETRSTSSKFTEQDCKSIQSDDILTFILKHKKLSYDPQLIKKHLAKIYHYQNFNENPAAKEEFILLFVSLFTTVLKSYHPEYRRQFMRCIFNFIVFAVISIDFFAASIYFYQTLTIFSIICSVGLISAFLLSLHRYQRINDFFDGIAFNLATQFQEQIENRTETPSSNDFPYSTRLITNLTKKRSSTRSNSLTSDGYHTDEGSDSGRTDVESTGSDDSPPRIRSFSDGFFSNPDTKTTQKTKNATSQEDFKQLQDNKPKAISPFPIVEENNESPIP
jgi:hypothetical protein